MSKYKNFNQNIHTGPNIPALIATDVYKRQGYTVSYNKDLKLPNWVSYELTRQETKGKEKRSNRFIAFLRLGIKLLAIQIDSHS